MGVESCSHPSKWPNRSRPVLSRHISMEHQLRRKHLDLNADTNASNENKRKEKRNEETFFAEKKQKMENEKKKKK